MNELERAVLNAIRACNHKMEMNQGTQRPLSNIKYGNENELLHYLKTLKINEDVSTLNAITQIETILLGGKQTLGVNSARIAFDDTYVSPAKLQEIKNELYRIYQTLNGIPHPSEILSDDELRNINSFEYLKNLQDLIPDYLQNKPGFDNVFRHCKSTDKYDIDFPYGNFYTEFLLSMEKEIAEQRKIRSNSLAAIKKYNNQSYTPYTIVQATNALNNANKKLESLENLIDTIYANHNFALERSYDVVKKEVRGVRQTNHRALQKTVHSRLRKGKTAKRKSNVVNKWTPRKADTLFKQARANFGDKFKPMMTTSQPSEVHLAYKRKQDPKQLRFGTQGQVYRYKTHINPIHEEWLRVQRRKRERTGNKDNTVIDHIYFNNLSRSGTKLEKRRETHITRKLEKLERKHPNLAVITIPSDEGLMNHHFSKDRKLTQITTQDLHKKLLAIANGTSKDEFAGDFHLSDKVKKALYKTDANGNYDKENEDKKLNELLQNSFTKLGFKQGAKLSPADQQAVYFHFLKFELHDFIIGKLGPKTFNFSCKDAIDRGGVSSAYYNLMKSIERKNPISQDEFEMLLHGAPTLVKGRGMNAHTHLMWNMVDAYLEGNKTNPDNPAWLSAWRNQHALPDTPHYYINQLSDYIADRGNKKQQYYGLGLFQNAAKSKDAKLEAAREMRSQLQKAAENNNSRSMKKLEINLENLQFKAASDRTLGKIFSKLKSHYDVVLTAPKPKFTRTF